MEYPNEETLNEAIALCIQQHKACLQKQTNRTGETYLDKNTAATIDMSEVNSIQDTNVLSPDERQLETDVANSIVELLPLTDSTIDIEHNRTDSAL